MGFDKADKQRREHSLTGNEGGAGAEPARQQHSQAGADSPREELEKEEQQASGEEVAQQEIEADAAPGEGTDRGQGMFSVLIGGGKAP